MSYDGSLDVHLTAKTIHESRPGVWSSPANILALYTATELFLNSDNNRSKGRFYLRNDMKRVSF